MNKARYKIMVQVFIGHNVGQGVRMGTHCFWDPKTDNFVSESFTNEQIFAVASAFIVYLN